MINEYYPINTKVKKIYDNHTNIYMLNDYIYEKTIYNTKKSKIKIYSKKNDNLLLNNKNIKYAIKIYSHDKLKNIKHYTSLRKNKLNQYLTCQNELSNIQNEIFIIQSIRHNNIVPCIEILKTDSKTRIVTKYMNLGECMIYDTSTKEFKSPITGSRISEKLAKKYIKEICNAVEYLHLKGICHRDIKPSNILLDENNICHLNDFGSAKYVNKEIENNKLNTNETVGTYSFLAPEYINNNNEIIISPFKSDIWSIGIVLYIFIYGCLPFYSDISTYELFQSIANDTIKYYDNIVVTSLEFKDFISKILEKNPNSRISIKEILQHNWMKNESND